MSFYSEASLVMIPSGVKEGKVYSAKPVDGTGDLTFSRGSDIEATRVNANGFIQKAQVNLALYSEDATNAQYTKTNLSVTANSTTAPDGTTTADTITATANGATLQGVVSVSAGSVYTVSVYLKRKTGTGQIGLRGVSNVVTNVTITSEWQRYETYMTAADSNGRYGVYLATSGDEVYAWGFQINYGTIAQDYQETTTAAVVSGITDNMPRLNYDPANPTCPSLLLEPSRTNGFPFSEYFGGWTSNRLTATANDATSPEGVQNAYKMAQTGGFTTAPNINYAGITAGSKTISIFAKAGTRNFLASSFDGVTYFNLSNGTIGTTSANHVAKIEDYGNGWYRCTISRTSTTTLTAAFYFADTDGTLTTADDGGYMYTYGAMIETGSYPTSYLPTYGSSATRTADACSKTGISSLIGTEGSIFVDFDLLQLDSFGGIVDLATSPASSSTRILLWENSGNQLQANFGNFGSAISLNSVTIGRHKALITYSASAFKFFVDGVKIGQTTPSTAPTGLSELTFVCSSGGVNFQKKNIHQTLLFTSVLSDAEAITLTSL